MNKTNMNADVVQDKIIKYRSRWSSIEAFEVIKETNAFVVFKNKHNHNKPGREAKRSDWQNWHDSFQEAKLFLIEQQNIKILMIKQKLKYAEQELEKLRELEEGD